MSKASGLIRLMRPVNCLMMGLAVLIGAFVTYRTLSLLSSVLGFLTAFTLTGASMVINDYWDKKVDAVNAPDRPLASGLISIKAALSYALFLITIGLLSAALTSLLASGILLFLAVASLAVSLLYSYRGKKLGLLGNFMVSACIAIPLFYGGFLHGGVALDDGKFLILTFFSVMVFLANTGREVTKGIADVEGDKLRGVRTVAIRLGPRNTAVIAALFYLSAVGLSGLPWLLSLVSWLYLLFVAVADAGFLGSSFILLHSHTKEGAVKVKKMVLIWMCLGLVAFVTGVGA